MATLFVTQKELDGLDAAVVAEIKRAGDDIELVASEEDAERRSLEVLLPPAVDATYGAESSAGAAGGGTSSPAIHSAESQTVRAQIDYTTIMSDFASAQSALAAQNMAAFAEIAKRVQMETVEIMLAAGKEISEDLSTKTKTREAQREPEKQSPRGRSTSGRGA